MNVFDDFNSSMHSHWTQVTTGGGNLQISKSVLRMGFDSAHSNKYTDAQIDDYTMLSRSDYLWKPPLRMTIRARFSHPASTANNTIADKNMLRGTAGFGFWNKPFTMQGNLFTLPESIWFFYSAPPSNMKLVPNIPGWGFKAQSIHTMRPGAIAQAIPLSLATVYARITGNIKPATHLMQRFAGANEALITNNITEWHTYKLEWHPKESIFWVDDQLILRVSQSPTRPLGFVAWLDNEYAIATPRGELKFGKCKSDSQWLDMDSVKIESL